MIERFARSRLARRLAALSILALVVWILAPLVLQPLSGFRERGEALASDAALLERLGRLEARRLKVAAAAAGADSPVFVAADAASALGALQARVAAAAPGGALVIEQQSPLQGDAEPGSPVALSISFTATQGALYAFLADLETRPPFVRVQELALKPHAAAGGAPVVSGSAVLSAVPLARSGPR